MCIFSVPLLPLPYTYIYNFFFSSSWFGIVVLKPFSSHSSRSSLFFYFFFQHYNSQTRRQRRAITCNTLQHCNVQQQGAVHNCVKNNIYPKSRLFIYLFIYYIITPSSFQFFGLTGYHYYLNFFFFFPHIFFNTIIIIIIISFFFLSNGEEEAWALERVSSLLDVGIVTHRRRLETF